MFLTRFPDARVVRLDKNQRSKSAILKCAYEVIRENPPIASNVNGAGLRYARNPLVSARDEIAAAQGAPLPPVKVEVVIGKDKDVEASEIPNALKRRRRELRCDWSDFAILYRQHHHRELIAEELARNEIPISIEGMDILDTPVIRDVLACLRAIASTKDSAALFRVAARPQFQINADDLRTALKAAPPECTLAEVLAGLPPGKLVLEVIQQAREKVEQAGRKTAAALEIVIRHFGFDPKDQTIAALREFIKKWAEKAITETQELGEFLEYMELFPEAKGAIPLSAGDADKGVKLLTAHGAKGLEFPHVFIVRANSASFPSSYKEPLVEFPAELFDPSAMIEDNSEGLHYQEERRLFYVAMTRARDSLVISAKRGTGKDSTPPGYLRHLLKDPSLRPWLASRDAKPLQVDLFAHEAPPPKPLNTIADWLKLPPAAPLNAYLSASGIETYEACPLQFKLERDWRISREVPAALQYGKAMHDVLKHYYDSVMQGRPATEAALVALFHTVLAETPITDPYQRDLYEKQGVAQLRAFLATATGSHPDVLRTEESFRIKIGEATVRGRIDRIDRLSGNTVVVVDYKTGKPKDPEDAEKSLQLSIYALAAQQKWGYKPERLIFYNLEDNAEIETTRTSGQLEEAAALVETVAQKIAQGKFDAKPGFHCRFCPYRSLCPFTEKQTYQVVATAQSN
jgi:DNA helicase II / ATP-dependent DNA helicase PcrA